MSDNSDTVEDSKKNLMADVTCDSCTTEFTKIFPFDRTSDDYHTPECVDPVVEVKRENLQDVKQETADENNTEYPHYYVKQEPAADDDNSDIPHFHMKVRF